MTVLLARRLVALLTGVLLTAGVAVGEPAQAAPARSTEVVCPPDRLPPLPFADVDGGSASADEIACLLGLGVVRGTTSTLYSGPTAVTRGQMALFLLRAARRAGASPEPGGEAFSDVGGAPEEVRDAVDRLSRAQVVRGYPDGSYQPGAPVRRDQMASFLVRLQHLAGGPVPAPERCFSDVGPGPHEDAVGTLCALGVAQGTGDGRFTPAGQVSRTQLAGFVARLLDVDAEAGLAAPLPSVPAYEGTAFPIDDATRARMSSSYRDGCPVALSELRLLKLRHWGFDGTTHLGELVVRVDAAQPVVDAFGTAYRGRVPVERMRLVDEYGADDDASMAANNTSGYNCRRVAGTSTWSQHAYGTAVDVNPVQNPYVATGVIEPAAGAAYTDRADVRPGMAVVGGALLEGFRSAGWGWGGDFRSSKDYQHFSANGR